MASASQPYLESDSSHSENETQGSSNDSTKACEWGEDCSPVRWRCSKCTSLFCEPCWLEPRPHRSSHREFSQHVQVPYQEQLFYQGVLDGQHDDHTLSEWHARDMLALWFSADLDNRSRLELEYFPRFNHILADHRRFHGFRGTCYPRLISFVGITGSGKSSLIRLLMEKPWENSATLSAMRRNFDVPIVGRREAVVPTSGDVHLYRDPKPPAVDFAQPMFFADCEGFDGGETTPAGSKARRNAANASADQDPFSSDDWPSRAQHALQYLHRGVKRLVRWAPEGGSKLTREVAVEKLFPRLLYNFSDVVVHVMTGQAAKTMENSIVKVLNWAQASESSAVNRIMLPHLLMVINQASDASPWDPEEARKIIFRDQHPLLRENHKISEYVGRFRKLGAAVDTLEDLLLCFYSHVGFIYLPNAEQGRNVPLLSSQLELLHGMIDEGSKQSQEIRADAHMLLSSQTQAQFFKLAFDHYAEKPDVPFDFLENLFKMRPLPNNLTNNVSKLIQQVIATPGTHSPESILTRLCPVIATSVALDAIRLYPLMPGRLQDVYSGNSAHWNGLSAASDRPLHSKGSYSFQIEQAFKLLCDQHVPCEFKDRWGVRCCSTRISHENTGYHQAGSGDRIGHGNFQSQFAETLIRNGRERMYVQIGQVDADIVALLQQQLTQTTESQSVKERIAWSLHERQLQMLFESIPNLTIRDIFSCFWCFSGAPKDVLPCGHAICGDCEKSIHDLRGAEDAPCIQISYCLLHKEQHFFDAIFNVHPKPTLAAPRLLALDGGGVRGIIELRVLEAIEARLGSQIPIHRFFDLIGGTSTGGLLAIGMGVQDWSVTQLLLEFKSICAFAFKEHSSWWIVQRASYWLKYGTRYQTESFESKLKAMLGSTAIKKFTWTFGTASPTKSNRRTFVTTTSEGGSRGMVLPNYIRPRDEDFSDSKGDKIPYDNGYETNDIRGLLVWQVARATTAAPTYFAPLQIGQIGYELHDGGLYHNNPAKMALYESNKIWAEDQHEHPDILLSVGSGYGEVTQRQSPGWWSKFGIFKSLLVLYRRLEANLNSEALWYEYFGQLSVDNPRTYVRFSPRFNGDPPDLDNLTALDNGQLDRIVGEYLTSGVATKMIDSTAFRLVATSFYLKLLSTPSTEENGDILIDGEIRCRFINSSDDMKAFATILSNFGNRRYLSFELIDQNNLWNITNEHLKQMHDHGKFAMKVRFRIPENVRHIDLVLNTALFKEERISACPIKVRQPEGEMLGQFASLRI